MSVTDEKQIWDFLKSKGLNDYAIAGVMGNLYAESGLRANNLQNTYEKKFGMTDMQYTESVDNGKYTNFIKDSAGYGLAQWTYWSRKQALLEFCKVAKTSIGDLTMQLNFLWKELQGYKSVMNVLNSAKSIKEASNVVLLQYERPADQSVTVQNKREQFGKVYYDKYAIKSDSGKGATGKMNLKTLIFTQNACYKSGKKHTVKGILVHSTGANNPKLSRYVGPDDGLLGKNPYNNHWNQPMGRSVCVHAFIGKLADGSIATYQTLPWDMVGWHSGSGKLGASKNANNNGYIGFEICEDGLNDAAYFNEVYQEAVELCAMLCKQYNLKPESPILICHSEGHALGIASNHGDVMHWFPKHGKSMNTFRADVKKAMCATTTKPEPIPIPTPTTGIKVGDVVKLATNATYYTGKAVPQWVKNDQWIISSISGDRAVINKNIKGTNAINSPINVKFLTVVNQPQVKPTFKEYTVKVTADTLNIRKGPGTNYSANGAIKDKGIYTIVEEATGVGAKLWGKLKSGAGWISLDYTQKR